MSSRRSRCHQLSRAFKALSANQSFHKHFSEMLELIDLVDVRSTRSHSLISVVNSAIALPIRPPSMFSAQKRQLAHMSIHVCVVLTCACSLVNHVLLQSVQSIACCISHCINSLTNLPPSLTFQSCACTVSFNAVNPCLRLELGINHALQIMASRALSAGIESLP